MKKPAVASAGLDLDFNNSNLGPSAGEQQSPQSQPVLDLNQQFLNKLDTASGQLQTISETNPHPSGFDEMRQENPAYLHQSQISSALPAPFLVCIGKVSAEAGLLSTTKGSPKPTGIATQWVIGSGCAAPRGCSDANTNL